MPFQGLTKERDVLWLWNSRDPHLHHANCSPAQLMQGQKQHNGVSPLGCVHRPAVACLGLVSWQLGLVHGISLYFLWQCIHYSLWMALQIVPHSQQCKVGAMGPSHKLLLHVAPAMSKKVKKRSCWRITLFPFPKDEAEYHKLHYLIECLVVPVKQHLFTCMELGSCWIRSVGIEWLVGTAVDQPENHDWASDWW
jgi:hypothetical protein